MINKFALPGVGYEYTGINFSVMSSKEIREWGSNIISDNVVLIRDQTLDEDTLVKIYTSASNSVCGVIVPGSAKTIPL